METKLVRDSERIRFSSELPIFFYLYLLPVHSPNIFFFPFSEFITDNLHFDEKDEEEDEEQKKN